VIIDHISSNRCVISLSVNITSMVVIQIKRKEPLWPMSLWRLTVNKCRYSVWLRHTLELRKRMALLLRKISYFLVKIIVNISYDLWVYDIKIIYVNISDLVSYRTSKSRKFNLEIIFWGLGHNVTYSSKNNNIKYNIQNDSTFMLQPF